MIRRLLRQLFCRHEALLLAPNGPAAVTRDGKTMEVLIEATCACGFFEHRWVDVTDALRRGMGN